MIPNYLTKRTNHFLNWFLANTILRKIDIETLFLMLSLKRKFLNYFPFEQFHVLSDATFDTM